VFAVSSVLDRPADDLSLGRRDKDGHGHEHRLSRFRQGRRVGQPLQRRQGIGTLGQQRGEPIVV